MRRGFVMALIAWGGIALAQEKPGPWQWSLALTGQGTSVDGDRSAFRELFEGMRSGPQLQLHMTGSHEGARGDVWAQVDAAGNAFLRVHWSQTHWRAKLFLAQQVAYSSRRIREDFLPGGTRVHGLYPGESLLTWDTSPALSRRWGEWVLERTVRPGYLFLRVGVFSSDGERVPEVGGFSFAANGSPAFYTPGLVRPDSDRSMAELGFSGAFRAVALRVTTGHEQVDAGEQARLPAYGLASPLDDNGWAVRTQSNRHWLSLSASGQVSQLSWRVAGLAYEGDFKPEGSDWRQSSNGARQAGFEVKGDEGTLYRRVGSAGLLLPLGRVWRLHVAARSESNGQQDDGMLAGQPAPLRQRTDVTKRGGEVEVRGKLGLARLRVALGAYTGSEQRRDLFLRSQQVVTYHTDDRTAQIELSIPRWNAFGWRLWARLLDRDLQVEVPLLEWNYTPVPKTLRRLQAGLSARRAAAGKFLTFNLFSLREKREHLPPLFEPVYDPTQELTPAPGWQYGERVTVAAGLAPGTASLALEVGYLRERFDFAANRPFPVFAPVNEEVEGLVAAASADWVWREKLRLMAQAEWVGQRQAVHQNLLRGYLQASYRLARHTQVLASYRYGELQWRTAASREFTGQALALGWRWER